ncbi:MAG TPA: hypothetical protein VGU74_12100 [Gemmatimonadales bacterium]|nr:hypothetical protein [Gemmatimonadales bacterium]
MKNWKLALALLVGWTGVLHAQRPLVVTAENLNAKGRGSKSEAVLPGDVLKYRLRFTNLNQGDVRGVVFTNPVPTGLRYVDGSAGADRQDVLVEYSTDGGKAFSARPMVTEVVGGKRVQKPAPPEQYTHVRWTVRGSIASGASVTAEFRATLPAAEHRDSSSH